LRDYLDSTTADPSLPAAVRPLTRHFRSPSGR
jgi:hypothetical protein